MYQNYYGAFNRAGHPTRQSNYHTHNSIEDPYPFSYDLIKHQQYGNGVLAQALPFDDYSFQNQLKKHDMEYLSTLYPYEIKELKQLVAHECDKMDYNGSMMYDECPDKVMFLKKCNDICQMADINCKYAKKCPDKEFLKDLISVLLANEMCRRREKRRTYY